MERNQRAFRDAIADGGLPGEHIVKERGNIHAIGALRGGGEAKGEGGIQPGHDPPVAGGLGVVDFVDDGVVEALAIQLGEAFGPGEFLDGRDDEVAAHVAVRAEIPGDAGFLPLRPHGGADSSLGLDQDFGAVGDDQDAGRTLEGLAYGEDIEGGEPGFPEAGGDGDEGAAVVVRADLIEGLQRAGLPRAPRVEDGGEIDRFGRDEFPVGLLGVFGVASDEGFIERRGLLPEIGEGEGELLIDGLRAGGLPDEVPLDAGFERGLGEIAAADEKFHAQWNWVLEQMIWSFEQELDEDDGHKHYYDPYESDEPTEKRTYSVLHDDGTTEEKDWFGDDESRRAMGKLNLEKMKAYEARKQLGFTLFGKYYQALWD